MCAASGASSISSHRYGLLEFLDVLKVLDRTLELPAIDRLSSLSGVLEADTQVTATAASRFGIGNALGGGVADLIERVLAEMCEGEGESEWKQGYRMRTHHLVCCAFEWMVL